VPNDDDCPMPSELTMSDLSHFRCIIPAPAETLASLCYAGVVRSAKARSDRPPRDEPIIDVSYPSYLSRADLSVLSADLYLSVFFKPVARRMSLKTSVPERVPATLYSSFISLVHVDPLTLSRQVFIFNVRRGCPVDRMSYI
jgi:hypothetical protein